MLGHGEVLPGIELAVRSMKKGEEAEFIIPYQLLFGELGCAPRVKPKSDGLFIITLLEFSILGDANALENLAGDDKKKYKIVVERVKELRLNGVDHFKQGRYQNACYAFNKCVTALELCHIENAEEQKEQQKQIVSLYTNMAVCFNKINKPAKVCSMCNEIARISDINKNCKALFQEGRAYFKLGEFEKAKQKLKKALNLEPNNEEIKRELQLLFRKFETSAKHDKEMWTRAFGMIASTTIDKEEQLSEEFKKTVQKMISCYVIEDQDTFNLPNNLGELELEFIKLEGEKNGMKLETAAKFDGIEYTLKKIAKTT